MTDISVEVIARNSQGVVICLQMSKWIWSGAGKMGLERHITEHDALPRKPVSRQPHNRYGNGVLYIASPP